MNNKYLVTGQGYEHTDPNRQTILLHGTFQAPSKIDATNQFKRLYLEDGVEIIRVYSTELV